MDLDQNQYLWDKTGETDPELRRWEQLLGNFSRQPAPRLVLPARASRVSMGRYYWLAAAACLVIAAVVSLRFAWQPGSYWKVVALAGTPLIDRQPISTSGRIGVGGLLETDRFSRAKLRLGLMGVIKIEPNSRVRLAATGGGRHRIALETGTISARLWAPPSTLSVDTPSATAIDLGCAFVLQADERGVELLRVTSGWVQFQLDNRQAVVPAGAVALARPGVGPGTPFFEDASMPFRLALEQLDFGDRRYENTDALQLVLSEARPKDSVSLLSLFSRVSPSGRGVVFDRVSQFVSPPSGFTREQAVDGTNQPGLDAWWKKLGLGDAKNWLVNWRDVFVR